MEEEAAKLLKEEVMRYSQDKEVIKLYSAYTKEELERNTLIHDAKQDGLKEGMEQEKIEIAKNMLKENMDIPMIAKVTGLSEEQVEELK